MPALPCRPGLEQMITQAMKDRAPQLYRELNRSGALAGAVQQRANVAEEVYEIEMSGRYEILQHNDDYLRTVQALTHLRNRACAAAIEVAMEFG